MAESLTLQIEDLLAERKWLVDLSRHLVPDATEAEDVAQETMIRALRQSGGSAPDRLRAWLAATARHVVFERHRGKGRRVARERDVAAPEDTGFISPEEALAQTEFRAKLAQLVMDLSEDERTAVSMKFYGGLSTAIIAERTGVQAHTVRQRVSRGVAKLRERLTQEDAGDGSTKWLAVAAGIAKRGSAGATEIGAATSLGHGAFFHGPWLAAGAAAMVALLGCVAFWLMGAGDGKIGNSPGAPPSAGGDPRTVAHGPPDLLMDSPSGGRASRETPRSFTPTPGKEWIQLIDPRTKGPAAGVPWLICPTGTDDSGGIAIVSTALEDPLPLAAGRTGPNGIVEFIPPRTGLVHLVTKRCERYARGSFALPLGSAVDKLRTAELSPGVTVVGRTVDERGRPAQGVCITMMGRNEEYQQVATSDANGRFEVPRVANFARGFERDSSGNIMSGRTDSTHFALAWPQNPAHGRNGASLPPGAPPSQSFHVVLNGEDSVPHSVPHDVGDIVLPRPRRYVGQVVDAKNRPAPGAVVVLGYRPKPPIAHTLPSALPGNRDFIRKPATAVTDSKGRFELLARNPVTPGLRIMATSAFHSRTAVELPKISRGETYGPLTLRLPDAGSIEIRLRDKDAAPGDLSWFKTLLSEGVQLRLRGKDRWGKPRYAQFNVPVSDSGSVHVVRSMLQSLPTTVTLHVAGFHPAQLRLTETTGSIDVALTRLDQVAVELTVEGGDRMPWMNVKLSALPPGQTSLTGRLKSSNTTRTTEPYGFAKRSSTQSSTVVFPSPLPHPNKSDRLWVYVRVLRDSWDEQYPMEVHGPFQRNAGPLKVTVRLPPLSASDRPLPTPSPIRRADSPVTAVAISAATGRPIPGAVLRCTTVGLEGSASADHLGRITLNVPAASSTFALEAKGYRTLQFGPLPLREGVKQDLGHAPMHPLQAKR